MRRVNREEGVTSMTLVSHLQLLWRGFTQGEVDPVFPFGVAPTCADTDTRAIVSPM